MKQYQATASIAAPVAVVWTVLLDGPGYAKWNSGVERIDGTVDSGSKITVHAAVSPGRAFPVKVSVDRAAGVMTWTGGMPLGLFRGVRTFTLTATPGGGTEFSMREVFSGPMLGLIGRSMPDLGPSFAQFAAGLRACAEAHATAG
jgi:hypothetical protein